MWTIPQWKRLLRRGSQEDRRRYTRFDTSKFKIESELGQIVDLSAHGMRVISQVKPKLKVGQKISFVISKSKKSLKIRGRITRVRRIGLRRFESAAYFPNVTPPLSKALEKLGRSGIITKIPSLKPGAKDPSNRPQFEMLDPYDVLGVPKDANDDTIRNAYRRLAKKFHPDLVGSQGCIDKFSKIDSAYKFLRDPEIKRIYDKLMLEEEESEEENEG